MGHLTSFIVSGAALPRHILFVVLYLLAVSPAWCDVAETVTAEESAPTVFETVHQTALYSGYRFMASSDRMAAAAPYVRGAAGMVGGFSAGSVGESLKISADGQFLHVDDYAAELFLDYAGLYRLKLESVALWHNREHTAPVSTATITARDLGSDTLFGSRTIISRANNRIKLGDNPIHVNLDYWQLDRHGTAELLFSDVRFDSRPNSTYSRSVTLDSVTREATVGLDAHLGPLNAAYSFVIRDFSNRAADSRDYFSARDDLAAGLQTHNVVNDSRVLSHMFTLYSDLSGGLTGAAQYVLTQRETSIERGDVRPSRAPADTIHTVAGDLAYTPFKELSLALVYRRLQIDRETPSTLYSPFSLPPAKPSPFYTATPGVVLVRPASSSVRDTAVLSLSYRPVPQAVYRLEYRAEIESRDNLPDPQNPDNPTASRRDSRQTHTGKASFIWRPVNALAFNATYSYATTDNPAYPASFSERHSGQATASYSSNGHWGVNASYLGRFESGASSALQTTLPRESFTTSASGSIWLSPLERVTLSASYSYLRSAIDQSNLFDSLVPTIAVTAFGAYRSTAHTYSLNSVIAVAKTVDLSVALQQTFAATRYSASDNSADPALSANGIGDPSRLLSTETMLTTRADWKLDQHLGCTLGYTFRNYNAGQPFQGGAVHETLLTLSGRW